MEQSYADLVERGSDVRFQIDTDMRERYKELKAAFEMVLPGFLGRDFKFAVDVLYYTGGYPAENSPPKSEEFADQIAHVLKVLLLVDKPIMTKLLKERGVKIEFEHPTTDNNLITDATWEKLGPLLGKERPKTKQEAINLMITEALDLQSHICQMSDSIKIGMAEAAKEQHDIEKPNYMTAVRIGAAKKRKGDEKAAEQASKVLHKAENLPRALEPVTSHGN